MSCDCFSFPTMGDTVVLTSARSIWIDGALARIRTPYRPPCRTISGSSSSNSSTDGITTP